MSGLHDDVDLGHTIAGWTGCVVVLAGCATVGAAMCAASPPGVRLGLAVIVLGGLVTWALHLAGWGKPSGPRPPEQWDWRVKDPMTGHDHCLACRLAGRPSAPATRSMDGTRARRHHRQRPALPGAERRTALTSTPGDRSRHVQPQS
ncbi:HGxxPAAW family protein [Microbispora amethystogenes]|uniref:Uncharacterized protein n=1 Tax=Microbispora amethystogenes TaxID=1427754 RepID=A0ABQ4F6E8_9ACTN|nr:HGxxPAAW family protein [Microbispora amethystogenes]GIH30382.1 hypothetical protein Mam01_05460 [Microbispora amethystogenes]